MKSTYRLTSILVATLLIAIAGQSHGQDDFSKKCSFYLPKSSGASDLIRTKPIGSHIDDGLFVALDNLGFRPQCVGTCEKADNHTCAGFYLAPPASYNCNCIKENPPASPTGTPNPIPTKLPTPETQSSDCNWTLKAGAKEDTVPGYQGIDTTLKDAMADAGIEIQCGGRECANKGCSEVKVGLAEDIVQCACPDNEPEAND